MYDDYETIAPVIAAASRGHAMMRNGSERQARTQALLLTLGMYALGLLASLFILFDDPPEDETYLQVTFLFSPEQQRVSGEPREQSAETPMPAAADRPRIASDAQKVPEAGMEEQRVLDRREDRSADGERSSTVSITDADSLHAWSETHLQGVFERDIRPEEAWRLLGALLEEHPEFREMVVREMIAGQGFVRDSLPPIGLYLDQIFRGGIRPTWDTQRSSIEAASRTFDPVQGWTNKGDYGPQLNILGLLKFLIDLIEGE